MKLLAEFDRGKRRRTKRREEWKMAKIAFERGKKMNLHDWFGFVQMMMLTKSAVMQHDEEKPNWIWEPKRGRYGFGCWWQTRLSSMRGCQWRFYLH